MNPMIFGVLIIVFVYSIKSIIDHKKAKKEKTQNQNQKTTTTTQNVIFSPQEQPTKDYIGAANKFIEYYNICKAVLSSDESLKNKNAEIICFLYFASIYTAKCKEMLLKTSTEQYIKDIDKWINNKLTPTQIEKVKKRVNFYTSIADERTVRGDWLSSNLPEDAHPLFLCSVALGDILVNPECGTDYEGAPIIVRDFFEARKTEKRLLALCDVIREYSLVVMNYAA